MLPELGRYAFTVLAAYAVAFALIGGLIAASLLRAARVKRALAEAEQARRGGGHSRQAGSSHAP